MQNQQELLNYYKGLIALRNTYDAFRRAEYDNIIFMNAENDFGIYFET